MASHLIGAGSFEDGDFLRRKTRLAWRVGSTCMGMRAGIRSTSRTLSACSKLICRVLAPSNAGRSQYFAAPPRPLIGGIELLMRMRARSRYEIR